MAWEHELARQKQEDNKCLECDYCGTLCADMQDCRDRLVEQIDELKGKGSMNGKLERNGVELKIKKYPIELFILEQSHMDTLQVIELYPGTKDKSKGLLNTKTDEIYYLYDEREK